MTCWFVSRHPGAIEWARRRALPVDRQVPHLTMEEIAEGDVVMGTLPVNLAADICRRGAKFYYLSLCAEETQRGKELSADDLFAMRAHLQRYTVIREENDAE
jgi:CRISPR-associated protein Csx16